MTSLAASLSMVGAILGGLALGWFSDHRGRRRAMATGVLVGLVLIPLWIWSPQSWLLILGAFAMQFMVQGSWGVVPAHLNELTPGELRGFFPGFAYQLGVLASASISYIEARMAERFSYSTSMGMLAAAVLVVTAVVIAAGPESKGVAFGKAET